MAAEDKIEEQVDAALVSLHQLNRVRPTQARLLARRALENLAAIMGYELIFPE